VRAGGRGETTSDDVLTRKSRDVPGGIPSYPSFLFPPPLPPSLGPEQRVHPLRLPHLPGRSLLGPPGQGPQRPPPALLVVVREGGREKRDRREDSCPLLEGYHVGRTRNKCRQGESPEGRRRRETWQAYGPGAEIERFHRLLSFVSLPSLSPLLFLALLLSDRQVVASHHGHLPRLGPHMVRPPSLPSLPLPPSSLSPAR
jgi:hypothetical protein